MVRAELATAIGTVLGVTLHTQPASRVHGGSSNESVRWESSDGPLFIKLAPAWGKDMFEAEAGGLEALRRANAVRVPVVRGLGADTRQAWLALEWIESRSVTRAIDALLGEQLARQHATTADKFGWSRNNTIGSTPQLNDWEADWATFLAERRLRPQLLLAAENGFNSTLQDRGAALLEHLGQFFGTYRPLPALLHGDLWSGNRTADQTGRPVIFDPAVYYGDREADLAMTRLFGGFGADFYRAYEAAWSLDPGAGTRTSLYNLYHVLNHLNLFGSGYLAHAMTLIDSLLAEVGH